MSGPFSFKLISIFDDGLAAHAVIVILLDHRALRWLPFFDHSGTVPIPIPIEVSVAFAHGYASADRADFNANFIR
jgi:hypothetical protein